jgi:predicted Rossmann fold nucleotide-binding protein DprA/Smf involved in DNA uptake
LTEQEQLVYQTVDEQPTDLETIGETCGLSIDKVTSILTVLQMKGLLHQHPGNVYTRRTAD